MLTAWWANLFLTDLTVKWRSSRSNISIQSELGHTILRVWKPYMRAFSYTKFCVTIPSIRWVTGKTSPDWANTVKYRIPALQRALHPEILHVTWNPFDIIAVDMSGAIIPKDISICSVVEEIARQIDHFTREWARLCLFSVWHSRVHYSASGTILATIFDVSESPIHRLSYAVPFVSIIIVVAEKSGSKVQGW